VADYRWCMGKDPLADAHRQLADAEHSLERELLDEADASAVPERVRQRARSISEDACLHDEVADRIDDRTRR
jgi:hypothetical protein